MISNRSGGFRQVCHMSFCLQPDSLALTVSIQLSLEVHLSPSGYSSLLGPFTLMYTGLPHSLEVRYLELGMYFHALNQWPL